MTAVTALTDVQWWCAAGGSAWTWAWQAYPGVWGFVVLVSLVVARLHRRGYAVAARTGESRSHRGHPAAVASGALLLWCTLDWPVGTLGTGYLVSVHALQFLSLAFLVPLLLLTGVGTAGLHGLSRRPAWWRLLRTLTNPLGASVGFALVVATTHVPAVVDTLTATQLGALALDLAWLGAGLLFWWPVVLGTPRRPGFTAPRKIRYVFFGIQPHLAVAVWLLTAAFPRYATYELAPRALPIPALLDQQIASAVMLLGMLSIVFGATGVLLYRWSTRGDRPCIIAAQAWAAERRSADEDSRRAPGAVRLSRPDERSLTDDCAMAAQDHEVQMREPPSMHRPEMDSETGLEIPTLGRTLRLFGRAFLLRCPNCGRGPVLEHWLKLRVRCGNCGLRLQRGEHDSFTGSMFMLFTLVGLVGYALMTLAILATRTTPWDLLQYGLPPLALVLVVALFPFSKVLWLAFDLVLRPVTPEELEWHRTATREFETERDAQR